MSEGQTAKLGLNEFAPLSRASHPPALARA